MPLRRGSIWLMAALSLLPALLFVYLGQFTRPMDWDDFCLLKVGQEQGILGGTLHWLRDWTGSYASFFFINGLAPLDTLAPPIKTTLIIVLWLFGSFWLIFEGLARLGINRRRPLAAAAAALAVAAVLNSLHSPQPLYWYADDYILLLPLLLMHLALWLRPSPQSAWRLIAGAALCFIAAGASEIAVGVQLAFLTFCLLMSFALLPSSVRRPHALFFGAGWLATLAGFIIQLSTAGAANRAAAIVDYVGMPDQPLSALMRDAFSRTFGYLGHPPIFGGFAMLLGVGMLVMLFGYRPPALPKPSKATGLVLPALWLGLIFQLLWLPALLLLEQASKDPLVFRRLFGLNMALILAFLALIWQRRRIQAHLQKQARGLLIAWHMTAFAVLFALLFLITQSGNTESGGYLLTTALAFLADVIAAARWSGIRLAGARLAWPRPDRSNHQRRCDAAHTTARSTAVPGAQRVPACAFGIGLGSLFWLSGQTLSAGPRLGKAVQAGQPDHDPHHRKQHHAGPGGARPQFSALCTRVGRTASRHYRPTRQRAAGRRSPPVYLGSAYAFV